MNPTPLKGFINDKPSPPHTNTIPDNLNNIAQFWLNLILVIMYIVTIFLERKRVDLSQFELARKNGSLVGLAPLPQLLANLVQLAAWFFHSQVYLVW